MSQIRKKFCLHRFYNRKALLFISLIFVSILVSSCFVSTFSKASTFVYGSADKVVNNETELKDAVNNAPTKASIIIALDNDISLSSTLIIPANKDITLTSSKFVGFYKLIGASDRNTITIEDNGKLKIDGIIVTHASGDSGNGIYVNTDCMLIMNSGEVSGNLGVLFFSGVIVGGGGGFWSEGGGVLNRGIFEMHGGKISNNESPQGYGGGVYNNGSFTMFGGEISNNAAFYTGTGNGGHGGGVENRGNFVMSGGKTSDNIASGYAYEPSQGGGVRNLGSFTMSGGEITNNKAAYGGGVCNSGSSTFVRQGGVISGNTVTNKDSEGKDVYTYSNSGGGGSGSGGNGGSSGGGGSGSGGNGGGSSNGSSGTSNSNGYSLGDVLFISVSIIVVMVVVVTALFLYFRNKIKHVEKTLNNYVSET